jgi:HAD superfamily hydrolase (TIGR01509 family)
MKYKALHFDFDGVILDTESAQFQAWTEEYKTFGLALPMDRWASCVGTDWNAFNPYKDLEAQTAQMGKPYDKDTLKARKDARAAELIHKLRPLPGVAALIRAAKMARCKLGVASSSHSVWVRGHLERIGLLEYFDTIKTADDVAKVKPAPDLYLACAEALSVAIPDAVALEDSPNGIKSAKAAGLYTIACPNSITRSLDLSQADRRVSRLGPELFF